MENFLTELTEEQTVLDLGSGSGGSFRYELYKCRTIGLDLGRTLSTERLRLKNASFVRATSDEIPLATRSIDAVICHHTLEHFDNFRKTLREMDRILKDRGLIWVAIPDGYSFDDRLYRFVFAGGGHVNQFTRTQLVNEVHNLTRFRLLQEVDLFSSFIYLKKPTAEEYPYYPPRARALFYIPNGFGVVGVLAINALTRVLDKVFASRFSQYGWGFVFAGDGVSLEPLHRSYFNVCSRCGAGFQASRIRVDGQLRNLCGIGLYACPHCKQLNAYVSPIPGTE
jgi:SAM-dependent methyltransferase